MGNSPRQYILGILSAIAVFFVLSSGLNWPFLIAAGLAAGTYAGVFLYAKPQIKIGSIKVDRIADKSEFKRLLLEAKQDLDLLRTATKQISNLPLRHQSQQLYRSGVRILEYLEKNPDRIPAARRFLGYYLTTAVDILRKYIPFQKSGLKTDEVKQVTDATKKALPVLLEAFEAQFTTLMQNDILDIESDIKVLELTRKSEGGGDGEK